jgi:predicted RNA-binding Zn-ribbon protein involved in translation (DUF1610 family)
MAGFFGPSEQDLEHLRSAVQSLGTTSVPGLAAALSWRERKTEKLLAHELNRPGTPIAYDPTRRQVRWAKPLPNLSPTPAAIPAATPTRAEAVRPARSPAPVLTPSGLKTLCPSCRVPLQLTGTASLAVCPQCGRLSSARTGGAAAGAAAPVPAAAPTPAPPPASPTTAGDAGPPLADRRSQEMFAAWVTAKPIPCPKCRTPLKHRGVSEYTCPACGQLVRFPSAPTSPAGSVVAPRA